VLEPCAGKLASSVLRGRSGSNATLLPDSQWAEGRYNMWDVILNSRHHPRVGFENESSLLHLVGNVFWEEVFF